MDLLQSTVFKSAFAGMVIPENANLMTKAEVQMRRYFQSHYPELSNE